MRQSITKRLRITEHNKMEKFREIITGEIPVHEIMFVYKTIHEIYIIASSRRPEWRLD